VGGDADRPHARPAAAVGNAEGLVQVEVTDVGADVTRAGEPHLGIHVGPVHVDLAAVLVDDLADFLDAALENPVGGRIGHHQRGELLGVRLGLRAKVGQVDVALGIGLHHHHLHPGHHRAGGIGAVGGLGNQADRAVSLAPRLVVRADHQQPRKLALRARRSAAATPG
jgi:hypothetical protein